jgi:hypothetical protein
MIKNHVRDENSGLPQGAPSTAAVMRWGYAAAVSLPLVVLNCLWITLSEMKTGVTELTISTLFIGVTFMLFVITLVNLVVRRVFGPRAALTQAELMAVYTMLSMSSVVAGVSTYGFVTPFLVSAFYYANKINGFNGFWHELPLTIGPRDPAVLKGFFLGHSTFFTPSTMSAWLMPLAMVGSFVMILLCTMLCMSSIVRRRWDEEEHLAFPVIALPLEMTKEGAPLYRSKMMWAGFAIPCFFHSYNSIASVTPGITMMNFNSMRDLVSVANIQPPWSGMGTLYYALHAAGIGFGYLISTDFSFSLWFFYLLKKAMNLVGVFTGLRTGGGDTVPEFPYTAFQGYGAWIALALLTIWTGRAYYGAYLRRAWSGQLAKEDENEPMSPRTAVVGFVAGFTALYFMTRIAGVSAWLPFAILAIYVLLNVAMSRIRAETALLSTELSWITPQHMLPDLIGTANVSRTDLIQVSVSTWFNLDYRSVGMPHELEGMTAIRRAGGGSLRPLVKYVMLAVAVAIVASLLCDLQLYYVNGADTASVNSWRIMMAKLAWNNLHDWFSAPKGTDPGSVAAAVFGVLFTCLLTALRVRFPAFPFHPAAYVLNTSFANDFFWLDMFVAWAIKSLILRYGGMPLYKKALPFFLGLILGDFTTGAFWSIIGSVSGLSLFRTFAT